LVPIHHLRNAMTVTRDAVAEITYFHVELDRHDVLAADGLPCESFLDTGNRYAFTNGGPYVKLAPDFVQRAWETGGCARLVTGGAELERIRARLRERAESLGFAITDDPDLHLSVRGMTLRPAATAEGTWRFSLPPGARDVRLR